MSLRARLLVGVAVVAVVLAVAATFVTRSTEAQLFDQVDGQLKAAADIRFFDDDGGPRRPGGVRPGVFGGPDDDDGFGGFGVSGGLSSLYVGYLVAGNLQTSAKPGLTADEVPLPDVSATQVRAAKPGAPFTVGSEGSGLRYRLLVKSSGPRSGAEAVVLGLPLGDVDDAVDRLVVVQAAATGIALAVLALVAFWVIRLGVRPIKAMTTTASAIAGGALSHRVEEGSERTEAGQLGRALNRMLGRIEDAFAERTRSEQRLRRFVADASHELRTPVTTIRGYAELYRAGGLADPEELGEAMRRTEQEAIRMGSLVDDLLHLARLDQGRPLERERVDLAQVAEDVVRDARAVDPVRTITTTIDGPAIVDGDDGRLRQVAGNLLGNARVHTPPSASIEVRVRRGSEGQVVLEVADQGPGMDDEVAARAFERFFRADPSRSRHRGGSGLGLAIVKATVHAHGGQVSLDSRPGVGTTVRVELPRATDSA